MAQIKISALTNLPNVALDDVVAIVDSSVGATKKATQAALLDSENITKNNTEVVFGHIAGGVGHSINPSTGSVYYPAIVGGSGNTIANGVSATENKHNYIVGGSNNTISNGEKRYAGIIGGYNNTLNSNNNYASIILGGSNHTIGAQKSTILAGEAHRINSGNLNNILGGNSNTIGGGVGHSIIGSESSSINGGDKSVILGAQTSSIVSGIKSMILGGEINSFIGDFRSSAIIGGYQNSFNSGSGEHATILNGEQNTINGVSTRILTQIGNQTCSITSTIGDVRLNLIANSKSSSINDSYVSTIIGSTGITMNNLTGSSVIGMTNFTPLWNNFTYVDNSYTRKTEVFNVYSQGAGVSGNIDIDCSLATIFTFDMTGDTTPNFINWKDGQRITFVINNTGAFAVPAATLDGLNKVYAKNGTINPTNSSVSKYNGVFIGGYLYLNEELNFQVV